METNLVSTGANVYNIAWIGTGVMGQSMAGHLAVAGHRVTVYNRSHEKAEACAKAIGARLAPTIADAVKNADFVFTMVGYPQDVEEVMLGACGGGTECVESGEGGVFESVRPGTTIIDMTTSSPVLAETLYRRGKNLGLKLLDAPVSGGDSGAKAGTLSIMVGGDREVFNACLELFSLMGKNIIYMGTAGNGQHTKACNQIAVAGATAAYTEALAYCAKSGLDPHTMLAAIGAGAAGSWQLQNMAPRALAGDHAPGFYVKHFIKDMKIAREEMLRRGLDLPMLSAVLEIYEAFAAEGHTDDGTQALIEYYEK